MGRRREHDEKTAEALLDAAERTVAEEGVDALSLREVASDAGTTTRAIYSLFGSKNGLVAALGVRAFNLLQRDIETLPATDQPGAGPHRGGPHLPTLRARAPGALLDRIPPCRPGHLAALSAAATDALAVLDKRFEPLADADLLGGRSISEASTQFRALCEGVAWTELRGNPLPPDPERFWRNAFHALITGFATPPPGRQTHDPTPSPDGRIPTRQLRESTS